MQKMTTNEPVPRTYVVGEADPLGQQGDVKSITVEDGRVHVNFAHGHRDFSGDKIQQNQS